MTFGCHLCISLYVFLKIGFTFGGKKWLKLEIVRLTSILAAFSNLLTFYFFNKLAD